MRVRVSGYSCLKNGFIIKIYGIKYCDRFICNNTSKFKDNGFRLFGRGL